MHLVKRIALWFTIALLLMPPAVLVTWALRPLWDAIESTTGIESLGHSGPATWCYLAVYAILLALAAAAAVLWRARRAANKPVSSRSPLP